MTMEKQKRATYHLYTFLVSKLLGSVGSSVYSFGMSMFILSATGSAFSFAINMVLGLVPRIVLAPIIGTWLDRYPKKRFVIGGEIAEVVTITLLLVYTMTEGLSVNAVYLATFFVTVFSTFSSLGFTASVANLVDGERLQKAISFNSIASSVAGILGPVIGGILFGYTTMIVFLIIHVVLNTFTLLLESTMKFQLYSTIKQATTTEEPMLENMKAGFRYVVKNPILLRIFIVSIAINFFATALNVGGDFVLLEKIQLTPHHIGLTEAACAIGMLVTSIAFASMKQLQAPLLFSKRALIGLGIVIALFAIPLIIPFQYAGNLTYYLAAMALFGVLIILTNLPIGLILQKEIEEAYRGRVFGLLETSAMSMMPLATILFGALFDIIPAANIFIISGLAVAILPLFLMTKALLQQAHATKSL